MDNEPINQAFIGYAPQNFQVEEEGSVAVAAPEWTLEQWKALAQSREEVIQGLQVEKLKLELVLAKVADLIDGEGKEVLKVG